jgi:hypothetical protein
MEQINTHKSPRVTEVQATTLAHPRAHKHNKYGQAQCHMNIYGRAMAQ